MQTRTEQLKKQLSKVEGNIIAHHGTGGCVECRNSVYRVTAPTCSFVSELTQQARAIIRKLNPRS